ncbi:hypothetical protein EAI_08615 [Harpegnathos saltator]|uniref:Uncharacterized protein n=1 Tax=Harpegnathos saltator TaxID=610380 RepID=E2B4I7_HARSA|nr:hypothetical protein EAI_08615 [Harpegnathos saltator]
MQNRISAAIYKAKNIRQRKVSRRTHISDVNGARHPEHVQKTVGNQQYDNRTNKQHRFATENGQAEIMQQARPSKARRRLYSRAAESCLRAVESRAAPHSGHSPNYQSGAGRRRESRALTREKPVFLAACENTPGARPPALQRRSAKRLSAW